MTVQDKTAGPGTGQVAVAGPDRCAPVRSDLMVCGSAVVAAAGLWSWWSQALGVDLAVRRGATSQHVGPVAVVVTVVVVAALGLGLLRLLERRSRHALRSWTILAASVCAVSLLGPLGATTVPAGTALASLHLVTAAVLVLGLRRVRGQQCPAA